MGACSSCGTVDLEGRFMQHAAMVSQMARALAFCSVVSACGGSEQAPRNASPPLPPLPTANGPSVGSTLPDVVRCVSQGLDDKGCAPTGWSRANGIIPPDGVTATQAMPIERLLFDFYIGRPDSMAACVNSPSLFTDAKLTAPLSGTQFVNAGKVGSLTAAQLVSEDALSQISAALSTKLQGGFANLRGQFEANFKLEVSKRSSNSSSAQTVIDVYELRLDGSFGPVGTAWWVDAFPAFAPCEGKTLITGVAGIYVRAMNASGKAETENLLVESAKAALEAAAGTGAWTAEIKTSVGNEVKNATSRRAELNVTMSDRFLPVWYRRETVTPAVRKCRNTDTATAASNDPKDTAQCKASLNDLRQPPQGYVRATGNLKWYVEPKGAKSAIVCQCDEQPALQ